MRKLRRSFVPLSVELAPDFLTNSGAESHGAEFVNANLFGSRIDAHFAYCLPISVTAVSDGHGST